MKLNEHLLEIVNEEGAFQQSENQKNDEKYRQASKYHTQFIAEFLELLKEYPHYSVALLEKHIREEDEIFGQDTQAVTLTPQEEGRIYSLVRSRHMLRIAQERVANQD